ncbi:hypothetical protein [Carboxylicivirga sp. RSCT41]|uniref:hypothetical protein n=1 Tax=Carboxylicivirga agarovorans TaxID=3417570 RepID=UPI003D3464E0
MGKVYLIAVLAFVMLACEKVVDEKSDLNTETTNSVLRSVVVSGDNVYIAPSGDYSGITDADNIEQGLNFVKASGGTIFLTDGNDASVDHYYTSRNIVVSEFYGCLRGEDKNNTTLHAGRQSGGVGFEVALSPWWSLTGGNPYLATVLQFDNSIGDVVVKDLTIKVEDDQPTDIIPDYYGNDASHISTFIEILGGEHDTYIENVCLLGKVTSAYGNANGMNVNWGVHVMLGSPVIELNESGKLFVKNLKVENIGDAALMFMRFDEGSSIMVDQLAAINVKQGITALNIFNSDIKVVNSYVKCQSNGFPGMFFHTIPTGLSITDNRIENSTYWGVILHNNVNSAEVRNNTFIDLTKYFNFGAILVRGSDNMIVQNDYKQSKLSGIGLNGGAVILSAVSSNNYVHEMKFTPTQGLTLCDMIFDGTDNALTAYYDGLNEIHNYEACENMAKRHFKMEEIQLNKRGANR